MPIAHRIPAEIEKDIIEVIEHIEKYIPICPPKHLKYFLLKITSSVPAKK